VSASWWLKEMNLLELPEAEALELYHSAKKTKSSEAESIRKVLNLLRIFPSDESIYENVQSSKVVEVYFYEAFSPIFLNDRFFELTSYSRNFMGGKDVFSLYERDRSIREKSFAAIQKTLDTESKFHPDIPSSILKENFEKRLSFHCHYEWICGLKFDRTKPIGFLSILEVEAVDSEQVDLLWGR
jgi:hypothetical protein